MISKSPAYKIKRGEKRKFEVACVAWLDLLGYGAMLRDAAFDPSHPLAQSAVTRIKRFHDLVRAESGRNFRVMVLNDAAAAFRDLSLRGYEPNSGFVIQALNLFSEVNRVDKADGYPGARMVIATGFRMRYEDFKQVRNTSYEENIIKRFELGVLDPTQAIHEAIVVRSDFVGVPALQANFAFTKAYLVDSAGSSAGFRGANCYVDMNLFENSRPAWIQFSKIVSWSDRGMTGQFGQLHSYDPDAARELKSKAVLSAIGVAEKLGGPDAVHRMLSSVIRTNLRKPLS